MLQKCQVCGHPAPTVFADTNCLHEFAWFSLRVWQAALHCMACSPAHLCISFKVCCAQASPLSSSAWCICSTELCANTSLMSGSCTSRSVCWGSCSLACKATCQFSAYAGLGLCLRSCLIQTVQEHLPRWGLAR